MPEHLPARRTSARRRRVGDSLGDALETLNFRLFSVVAGTTYLGAGSFIGIDSVALLLGYATLRPTAIAVLISGIALTGLVIRLVRRRRRNVKPEGHGLGGLQSEQVGDLLGEEARPLQRGVPF